MQKYINLALIHKLLKIIKFKIKFKELLILYIYHLNLLSFHYCLLPLKTKKFKILLNYVFFSSFITIYFFKTSY